MLAWRICKAKHVASAFSGPGAEKHGGRWNYKGQPMVYASTSLSLAALELFVHLQPDSMPDDLHSVVATIPDELHFEEIGISSLPANWRDYPAPASLQEIGTVWLREARSLMLIVPSAVNPEEKNILINPLHPDADRITDIKDKPFQFDPRMRKHESPRQ
jgi:RES domain-containing protein